MLRLGFATCIAAVAASAVLACTPRDFIGASLASEHSDPEIASVLIAYPSLRYEADRRALVDGDQEISIAAASDLGPAEVLEQPTFGDQFRYVYPLQFNMRARETSWFDPGRVRNSDFMSLLYFSDEATARASLVTVEHEPTGARFNVTEKRGVACQLQAVLSALGSRHTPLFENIGGSFNWRTISGTDRLSVHSYGAAIDLNSRLGAYWRWQGHRPGGVGRFENHFPQDLVLLFERYGFIWGGKWHHYDSMHFEYRPELIIYARLQAQRGG